MGALIARVVEMGQPRWKQWQVREAAGQTMLNNKPAHLVLRALAERADEKGYTHVHRERIVRETGVALRTLQNVLRCLREVGLVEFRRVNQAERLQRGVMHSEEFQLSLHRLGEDLREEFAAAYAEVQGKGRVYPQFGEKSVAETHVAETQNVVAETQKSVAATHPPDPLYGGTSQEHLRNIPLRAEAAPQGVGSAMLAVAATKVRAACSWKGVIGRQATVACVEALGDLCRDLGCDASEAGALVIDAWKLDQQSATPTKVVAYWFGGPWRRWVDCVLADRAASKRAEVGTERHVELDACALVECQPGAVDAWRGVLAALERVVNRQSFATWLRPTKGLRVDGDLLVVRVPSLQFTHLGDRYEREIAEAVAVSGVGVRSVSFEVGGA